MHAEQEIRMIVHIHRQYFHNVKRGSRDRFKDFGHTSGEIKRIFPGLFHQDLAGKKVFPIWL